MSKLKIALFGSPQLAADIFRDIADNIDIVAVVTSPDRVAGRGQKLMPSSVKIFAEEKGIPVFHPKLLDADFAELLKKMGADIFLVIAFGRLFSAEFLAVCPAIWNVHFSLLPEFRGASPVPAAILAGKEISGVSIFMIRAGLDDGPIIAQKSISIANKRADEVFLEMKNVTIPLLINLFSSFPNIASFEQNHSRASFCGKMKKSDGFLLPESISAHEALQKVRAFSPWPGSFFQWNGKGIKIFSATISAEKIPAGVFLEKDGFLFLGFFDGALLITELQVEGKKRVLAEDFLRGNASFCAQKNSLSSFSEKKI